MAKVSIPRWRGFNILDLFSTSRRWDEYFPMGNGSFEEDAFRWMEEWGFDFARIPMSYLYFVKRSDRSLDEARLEMIDQAIEFGRRHGVHVSLNFHRAPGFCVTSYPFDTPEPYNLFRDQGELELFCSYWNELARRYKGVAAKELSFDLLNEPPSVARGVISKEDLWKVYSAAVKAVRDVDSERLVLVEPPETAAGVLPLEWLDDLGVAASPHCYRPVKVSHYRTPWAAEGGAYEWAIPEWPLAAGEEDRSSAGMGQVRNRAELEEHLAVWLMAADEGFGVHLGETGAYSATPHRVVLAWLSDLLGLLGAHGIGFALWNLRGPCGIVDSGRWDVDYEDWYGHRLDRKMLRLLQRL